MVLCPGFLHSPTLRWRRNSQWPFQSFLGFIKVAPQNFTLKGGICSLKKRKTIGTPDPFWLGLYTCGKTEGKSRPTSSSVAYTICLQEAVSSLVPYVVVWLFSFNIEGQSEPFKYIRIKSKYLIVSTDYWKEAVNLSISCNRLATCFS